MLITTESHWEYLYNRIRTEPVFFHKIFIDHTGHSYSTSTASYHFLFDDGTYCCLATEHPDSPSFITKFDGQLNLSDAHKVISLHKKDMVRHNDGVDLGAMLQLNGVELPTIESFYTPIIKQIKTQFRSGLTNQSIPLMSWMDTCEHFLLYCQELYTQYSDTEETDEFQFVNEITIPTLARIENAGLCVGDSLVMSNYNIHTATGRPSNTFGGINFAALNKSDGSREKFVSRWGSEGLLVQFDYEAFHLRLAAHMMNYELPATSVHLWLAQQYFGTTEITDEQYEESKAKTFAIIYGQTMDCGGVDFFENLQKFSGYLWNDYLRDGFIRSMTGRKIVVTEPNQNKVFNYLMQITETEQSIIRIKDALDILETFPTPGAHIVLYTYDAILLDVHRSQLDKMPLIESALNSGGFPVRQYRGDTYANIILHKI